MSLYIKIIIYSKKFSTFHRLRRCLEINIVQKEEKKNERKRLRKRQSEEDWRRTSVACSELRYNAILPNRC